ncbi:hypothetical protein E2C01_083891 [Portunus trituberculatus]|uniref:Uncharacterized protein n=1 Tax=Portunus trituberculatus TaxID=210409 RepID=A0A5B7J984_PORTR|nr:hypothetical protein [Portunus trituberculatus]
MSLPVPRSYVLTPLKTGRYYTKDDGGTQPPTKPHWWLRPPTKQTGRDNNASFLHAATPRVDERTTGNVALNRLHFPQDNKLVVLHSHGLPSNKPITQERAQLPDR